MEENKRKIFIIIGVVILLIGIGVIVYLTKFRNDKDKPIVNEPKVDNYVENKLMNLDDVVKKDRSLIQTALNHVPYRNGLYQSIYSNDKVKIDNIKPELLFNMAYIEGVNEIKNNDEYNKIKEENNVEMADFFVKKQDIIDNIKKLYDLDVTDLPNEIELLGGNATAYKDYYGFIFAGEPSGYVKISKVLSYSNSDSSLVIYEKPAFIGYDFETKTVTLYKDDLGQKAVLTIENEENSTSDNVLKKFKDNLSLFDTYEHIYKRVGDNYYWSSVSATSDEK